MSSTPGRIPLPGIVPSRDFARNVNADSLHLREMCQDPAEPVNPWSAQTIAGLTRFLARVQHLAFPGSGPNPRLSAAPCADKTLRRIVHQTIRHVTENPAASAALPQLMLCTRAFSTATTLPLPEFVSFLRCLHPFAPRLTEAIHTALRPAFPSLNPVPPHQQPWPSYDPAALIIDEVEIAVQVNNVLCHKINVPLAADPATVEAAALATPHVVEAIATRSVKKVIVVPHKLVNIVVS